MSMQYEYIFIFSIVFSLTGLLIEILSQLPSCIAAKSLLLGLLLWPLEGYGLFHVGSVVNIGAVLLIWIFGDTRKIGIFFLLSLVPVVLYSIHLFVRLGSMKWSKFARYGVFIVYVSICTASWIIFSR